MKCKTIIIIISILSIIGATIGISYLYFKTADINISKDIKEEYNLDKQKFNDRDVYILSPKENKTKTVILYQHGGSYITNLTSTYWDFLGDIANDTKATIIIPDYPLAPDYYYQDVFDMMMPLYSEVIKKVGKENLIIMGDSAGGGLSLAMCQYAGEKNIEQPHKLILISPWLDISLENEKIEEVQENDPLLKKDLLKVAGQLYSRGTEKENYLVSPIYGPLDKIENVTIFSGTYDILNPDAELFVSRAKEQGLQINYKKTEKATHIWILSHNDENIYHAQEDYLELVKLINEGV